MRTIRGPNDNHPAVRYDRVQRLVAAALKRRVVIAFALTALALRLATLTWGAGLGPYDGMYYPDEWGVWGSAQNFPGNYLTNQSFLHGTALQYVVGALLIPIKAWWEAGEPLIHGMNYAQFVLLSVRMAHVLLGALAVLLVYRLGKMLFDRATGLLAGALVAVSFYHVLTSAFTTLDVPASFFVLLTIILGARAARSGRWRDFAWLGVSAGLLLATRITVALAFVPVAVVLAFQLALPRTGDVAPRSGEPSDEESAPPPGRGVLLLGAGVAAAAALLVFVVAMPHVILYPRGFLSAVSGQAAGAASSIATPLGAVGAWVHATAIALTVPVAALALAGVIVAPLAASRSFRGLHWALVTLLMATVVFWGASLSPRQLVPIAPILCLYAALPVAVFFRASWPTLRRVGALMAAGIVGYSLYQTLLGIEHRRSDSRSQAAAYIATQLPRGVTMALAPTTDQDPWTTHPWRYPKLPPGSFELVSMLDRPEFIVTTSYALDDVREALRSGQMGVDRVWPSHLAHRWYNSRAPTPEEFRFYESLLDGSAGYVLERRWPKTARVPLEFPAPEIRLYRLARDSEAEQEETTRAPAARPRG